MTSGPVVTSGPAATEAAAPVDPEVAAVVLDLLTAGRAAAAPPATAPAGAPSPGPLLGVWAHPDDETYLSGALMATAAHLGARVVCVTATRGELGGLVPPGSPPGLTLDRLRVAELAEALDVLGVREQVLLGLPDGGCAQVAQAAAAGPAGPPGPAGPVERIAGIIRELRPAVVVTFGPDGFTGHPDHRAVSAWTTTAFARAAPDGARLLYAAASTDHRERTRDVDELLGIAVDGADLDGDDGPVVPPGALAVRLNLAGRLLERKVAALRAHASQTAGALAALGPDRFAGWVAEEAFVDHRGRVSP
ncbi:PIG-L deacetylase family protein [Parafrankia sp. BMG5.11]|uniref:PIG-L deacetylase family protein n=1 Tax=Parafrankia sp. BMG5.11 TaxID=222540 RepID=UPI00103CD7CA|nr:PIG-L family deacetylase [Parafrankia sp. BMG5.11]TCJ35312.1 PIG-L family deacetylase [Parafrankia sp. BMG5.11]